jgi:sec-independent protein translocase protein TatA
MSIIASLMNLGGPDLIVILLIVLVLFGAKKLPELARGMGQAVKEFQKAKDEFSDEIHKAGQTDPKAAQSTVPLNPLPDSKPTTPPGDQAKQV